MATYEEILSKLPIGFKYDGNTLIIPDGYYRGTVGCGFSDHDRKVFGGHGENIVCACEQCNDVLIIVNNGEYYYVKDGKCENAPSEHQLTLYYILDRTTDEFVNDLFYGSICSG